MKNKPQLSADVNWSGFFDGDARLDDVAKAIRALHLRTLVLEGDFAEADRLVALMLQTNAERARG